MILENFDTPSSQSNTLNVQILNRVRLIAIVGQIILILFASWYLDIHLPLKLLFSIIAFEAIFQVYSYRRIKQSKPIKSAEICLHILLDSVVLAGLVYFSGGASNPFIYLLLLSIALGTFMLTPSYLVIVTVVQLVLYSLLNLYQRPLELGDASPLASFHLHLAGMWVNFALTAVLIAVFGLLARNSMLKQEKQIQKLREKQLKDEQILSLGIMSASAAHELGTPLATMAIVVDDLNHQKDASQQLHNDMNLLADQINNCRNIIQDLNEKSRHTRKQLAKKISNSDANDNLKQQLQSIIDNWLVYRPQVALKQQWSENLDNVEHHFSISVEQAVINLLNNAADASLANNCEDVEIHCRLFQQQLVIEIVDFGTGLTPQMKQSLGANIQESKKADGLGWGLFLSNASIERMGGEVLLIDTETGGTLTRVNLPLEFTS